MTTVILAAIALVGSISTGVVTVMTYHRAGEAVDQSKDNGAALQDAKIKVEEATVKVEETQASVKATEAKVEETQAKVDQTASKVDEATRAAQQAQASSKQAQASSQQARDAVDGRMSRLERDLREQIRQAETVARELTEALRRAEAQRLNPGRTPR